MLWRKIKDFMARSQRLLPSSLTWSTLGVMLCTIIFGSTPHSMAELDKYKVAVFLRIPDGLNDNELAEIEPRKRVLEDYLECELEDENIGILDVIIVSRQKIKPEEGIKGFVRSNKVDYYISGEFMPPLKSGGEWALRWELVEVHPYIDQPKRWRQHRPEMLVIKGDSDYSDILAIAKQIKGYYIIKVDIVKPVSIVFISWFQISDRLEKPLKDLQLLLPVEIVAYLKQRGFEKRGYVLETLPLWEVEKCAIERKETSLLLEKRATADYIIEGYISMVNSDQIGISLYIVRMSKKVSIPLKGFTHDAEKTGRVAELLADFIMERWGQAVREE